MSIYYEVSATILIKYPEHLEDYPDKPQTIRRNTEEVLHRMFWGAEVGPALRVREGGRWSDKIA